LIADIHRVFVHEDVFRTGSADRKIIISEIQRPR
jgi:hypothetical protein